MVVIAATQQLPQETHQGASAVVPMNLFITAPTSLSTNYRYLEKASGKRRVSDCLRQGLLSAETYTSCMIYYTAVMSINVC